MADGRDRTDLWGGSPAPPPGWYPDPAGGGAIRYWDGAGWTDQFGPAGRAPVRGPTSGFAIASLVFGIIGGFVFAIVCGLVARSRIRSSGGWLRGRGLATAGMVLGCVWAVLFAIMLTLGAIGVLDTPDNASRYQGDEREIARTVDELYEGLDDNDGARLCGELFTARFADLVASGSGKSCVDHMDSVDRGKRQETITVKRIAISGESATVDITEGGSPGHMTMLRQADRWRIDDIEIND